MIFLLSFCHSLASPFQTLKMSALSGQYQQQLTATRYSNKRLCQTPRVIECVSVSRSFWAGRIGRGGESHCYVFNSRCSSSVHGTKLQALTAVLTGQQSSWLELSFEWTLSSVTYAPVLVHSTAATQGRVVWQYPVGKTVRFACIDICSSITLTVIAVLQSLDMFFRGADRSLALPWKETSYSEQYLQRYTKTYGVQSAGIYCCCLYAETGIYFWCLCAGTGIYSCYLHANSKNIFLMFVRNNSWYSVVSIGRCSFFSY